MRTIPERNWKGKMEVLKEEMRLRALIFLKISENCNAVCCSLYTVRCEMDNPSANFTDDQVESTGKMIVFQERGETIRDANVIEEYMAQKTLDKSLNITITARLYSALCNQIKA